MARAYLGLGGNVGDARRAIATAIERLESGGARIVARSSDYETPPWGKTDQPAFTNAVVEVETRLAPRALLVLCLAVERSMGRERLERWGPRLIDIDILTYDDMAIEEAGLSVPHPYVLERAFVLAPLTEIAPDLVVRGVRVADALRTVDAAGIVRLAPRP